ncbi:MAG: histidine kinase [Myxococcales bacterium]|nr:histidine kinase [Myxococcales bacterium]
MPGPLRWLRRWSAPLLYAVGATVWILATDGVVDVLSDDQATLESLQLLKGLLFVGLTSALLALLVHRVHAAREALERNVEEQQELTRLVQRCEDLARTADSTTSLGQSICETVTGALGVRSALVRLTVGAEPLSIGAAGVDGGLAGVGSVMNVELGRPSIGALVVSGGGARSFTPAWEAGLRRIGLAIEAGLNRLEVRAMLDTFLETVPISVVVFDGAGRLQLINAEARSRAGGATPRTAVARQTTLADVLAASSADDLLGPLVEAQAEARRTRGAVVASHRYNGRTYEATHVPLPDSSGRLDAVAMLARDVTDELALRTALRALTTQSMRLREEEQARLARDLHDDLGQRLTALKLQLRAVERVVSDWKSAPGDLVDIVVEASQLADETVLDVQRISQALRPAALGALGLSAALRDEVAAFSRRSGIACTSAIDELTVEPPVATHAFRIAQEALTNVARHARANEVRVGLGKRDGALVLEIEDDGVGFESGPRLSLGLLGMDERARQVGGRLDVQRRASGGTVVRLTIEAHS